MVGTVTLNPCIDRTCRLNGFVYGGMNRIQVDRRDVSGKGINVSLALNNLGFDTKCSGFLYREGGDYFLSSLKRNGLEYEYIPVEGRVRENIKLWDSEKGVTTEINQKGAPVTKESVDEFLSFYSQWLSSLSMVVLTGSVPMGVENTIYKDMAQMAAEKDVKVILDAEGSLLLEGIKARPFLIKPNRYEFVSAFAPKKDDTAGIMARAKELIEEGLVSIVVVTMGEEGAYLVEKDHVWRSMPPKISVKSTQGAGDSVVAGICASISMGLGGSDMLRYGVAAASSTVSKEGTEMCTKKEFDSLLPLVRVEEYLV